MLNLRRHQVQVIENPLRHTPLGKRRMASEQEIERAPKTIKICRGPRGVTVKRLLRRQVIGRSHHGTLTCIGQRSVPTLVRKAGQPQIQKLDDATFIEQ